MISFKTKNKNLKLLSNMYWSLQGMGMKSEYLNDLDT